MIKWLKDLFSKTEKVFNNSNPGEVELTEDEKGILSRLKRHWDFSSDIGRLFYLVDGTYVEILGNWSFPDIDITKRGTVVKGVENGRIYELETRFALFFNRKPHNWVKSLDYTHQHEYFIRSLSQNDDELTTEFFSKIPKSVLREMRLKELGI